MRRFETFVALLAVIFASVSALQIPGRIVFALAAIMLLTFLISRRLRAAIKGKRDRPAGMDAYERARRIHEERSRRFDR